MTNILRKISFYACLPYYIIYIYFLKFSFILSIKTAAIITQPIITSCKNAETPIKFKPFLKVPIIKEPTNVPAIIPSPPLKLVPPITEEATAYNSYPEPAVGCPDKTLEANTIPAIEANKAENIYTNNIVIFVLIPDNLAACIFEPEA